MVFLFCGRFSTSPSHRRPAFATQARCLWHAKKRPSGRIRRMRKEALVLAVALLWLNVLPGRAGAD